MKKALFWVLGIVIAITILVEYNKSMAEFERESKQPCLEVTINEWYKGGFGAVGIADFTITNKCKDTVKDAIVEFSMWSKTETQLGSRKKTVYETIPGNGKVRVKKFNIGFMHSDAETLGAYVTNTDYY